MKTGVLPSLFYNITLHPDMIRNHKNEPWLILSNYKTMTNDLDKTETLISATHFICIEFGNFKNGSSRIRGTQVDQETTIVAALINGTKRMAVAFAVRRINGDPQIPHCPA